MIEEILDLLGEKIPFTEISYINVLLMMATSLNDIINFTKC